MSQCMNICNYLKGSCALVAHHELGRVTLAVFSDKREPNNLLTFFRRISRLATLG